MKNCIYISILFLSLFTATAKAGDEFSIVNLKCEMLTNPVGIDATSPRFSWQLNGNERGLMQVAYEVIVASSSEKLINNQGDLWNSGMVRSGQSIQINYHGKRLQSRQQCFWKVKVWTNKGQETWSESASFNIGLFNQSDWKAKWIGLERAFPWDSVSKFARLSARYFRKEFEASKKIKRATVYISGLGLDELYINGKKIGDQVLSPSPTDYSKAIKYNTFDVTTEILSGKNAIGVILGNGRFFTMRQNYKPKKWHNFGFPRMILQLEIEFTDGTKQLVASDGTWKVTADGPIRTNNEYDGEEYDATKELTGWNKTSFRDEKWLKAELVKSPGGKLEAQMNETMRVMEIIKPISIKQLSNGKWILDMGQNMAGRLKLNVTGKKGDTVTLRFAESLQPDGELYIANLRDALVTDKYILKGGENESWSPRFVFHGFRYVEINNYPGNPTIDDFAGEVIYDDLKTIGSLETSNSIINQIHKNAYWGIRSNYKGMPIDCPQRNERQPWLGDRTMGAYGESFLFDNEKLYAKWLDDIAESQTPDGSIPDVAPNFWYYYKDNMTWPGAFLTIADMLYRQFGDKQPLMKHYPAMKKWMEYMKRKYMTPEFIVTKDSYGDWCVPPESPKLIHSKDSSRNTDPKLIATAYYYYFLQLMQKFAMLTNHSDDIGNYQAEAIKVGKAFNDKFYKAFKTQYSNNTVTANILALTFQLVPQNDREKVFKNIADKILNENGGHISTGVVGTQWLMRWLTIYGRADIAYKLASNTTYPSWGYMVEHGATTIWELWNGDTADPSMNSQNHVMLLGDLLIWMYENLGGIKSDITEVGFKKIIMKPSFDIDLNYAKASYDSPYGRIESSWTKNNDRLRWEVTVPANTNATIYLPATSMTNITEEEKMIKESKDAKLKGIANGLAEIEIGSGHYSFTTILKK